MLSSITQLIDGRNDQIALKGFDFLYGQFGFVKKSLQSG